MILDEKKKTVIPDNSILYIEASINYSIIHRIHSTKPVVTYARTIKVLQERLGDRFIRISRKHLVNPQQIETSTETSVTIQGVNLKISRRYQRLVNSLIFEHYENIRGKY
jgi:DNA-binding LytR/AlgR family response regulator